MPSKKKGKNQAAKQLKPAEYIRTKARQLPVYKCYKSVNQVEDREMSIVVVRRHPQGTFTLGAYMIDKWCLGVKDSFWQFNIDESDLNDFLSTMKWRIRSLEEVEYVEAHNWVYGAVEFALDAGISPCKDFGLTQYLLEEDDERVELIEYEFGRDGKYCLVAKNRKEADRYVPTLEKNLGKGNFSVEIGFLGADIWDDEDDEDEGDEGDEGDDEGEGEDGADASFPFAPTPPMEYTYKGGTYPQQVELHFPEVEGVVLKETENITDEEIAHIQLLAPNELREDLQNLVLREIGRQWGKNRDELEEDESNSWCVVGNSLMLLTGVATVGETLPVVLEVMRQSYAFHDFNFGDSTGVLLDPVLCVLVKDNPLLLRPFLLEEGLCTEFKLSALELLEHISRQCPQVRQEIIGMAVELLREYKLDLAHRRICDGTVVAFAIGILVGNGAVEHLPLIEDLYATGLVDEMCEGNIEEVRREIRSPWTAFPLPPMDPYSIRDSYIGMFT